MDLHLHKKTSLYIHIPFCTRKCWYCDFYSLAGEAYAAKERTISKIIRQFDFFTDELGKPVFETIYIGGGTPNSVTETLLSTLLDHIAKYNRGKEKEFTIEANPELINKSFLDCIEHYGVKRLSLGVQSFCEKALKSVGRFTSCKSINEALELIGRNWKGALNIDLLIGLPSTDTDQCSTDIEKALVFEPDHISLYSLTVEKGTTLASLCEKGRIRLPPDQKSEDCFDKASLRLNNLGYNRYEVSNFAREGHESIHNLSYWMMKPYLGIGPSAVSSLVNKRNHCIRISTTRDLKSFTEHRNWGMQTEEIDGRDFLFEHLLMGFRTKRGVSRRKIQRIFALDIYSLCRSSFSRWSEFVEASDNEIHLNDRGLDLLNRFLRDILDDLETVDPKLPYCWL